MQPLTVTTDLSLQKIILCQLLLRFFLKLLCLKASEKTELGNFRREMHKLATWAALLALPLASRCNTRIQHTKKEGKATSILSRT